MKKPHKTILCETNGCTKPATQTLAFPNEKMELIIHDYCPTHAMAMLVALAV